MDISMTAALWPFGRGLSVRAKVLGILAAGTLIVAVAGVVLILVARQSDHLLERASAAQTHLELLMLQDYQKPKLLKHFPLHLHLRRRHHFLHS